MKTIAVLLLSYLAVSLAIPDYDYNNTEIEADFVLPGGDYKTKFYDILDGDLDCWYLRFSVRSSKAIYVQFLPTNAASDSYYEVMIGVHDNSNTCILKQPGKNWLADKRTKGVITGNWQHFYIQKSGRKWEIGFQETDEVIASGEDKYGDQHLIEYIRVRSEKESSWKLWPGLGRRPAQQVVTEEHIAKQNSDNPAIFIWPFPEFSFRQFYLVFGVKAGRDANIVFSETGSYADDFYHIMIGARTNLFVCLLRKKGEPLVLDIPFIDILKEGEWRYFWVKYWDGILTFGRYKDEEPIFVYEDESPLRIKYLGITSQHVTSEWEFYLPCTAIPSYEYNNPITEVSFDLDGGDYQTDYRKLLDGDQNCWYLRFYVKSTDTVLVQFSPTNRESDEYYEVMIGAWNNKNTCILKQPGKKWLVDKRTQGVITGEWQYFYIRQSHGYWEIGIEKTGPVIASGYDEDFNQHHIRYFRVRSEQKSWWKLWLAGLGRRIARQDIHNPGTYIWHFPEFYSTTFYLVFGVKSGQHASIVFSPTNGYGEEVYEIIIGAKDNERVQLRRNKDGGLIKDEPFPGILQVDGWRYFWVSYSDGVLKFGRYDEKDNPIFEYKDENPLEVRYFGITSEHVKSWWKFYLPCPEPLVVCEHESLRLRCPRGLVSIKNALYGRENKPYCWRKGLKKTKGCGDPEHSLQVLREQCKGQQECTIDASNDVFDDPCVGTFKYLQVEYDCCLCD